MGSCVPRSPNKITKFVQLGPVTSKRAPEIAYQLLDTFSIFGASSILQSDNGREFVNSAITELSAMWDGLKIVHEKPIHSQSQGSVERVNRDIEDMLMTCCSQIQLLIGVMVYDLSR